MSDTPKLQDAADGGCPPATCSALPCPFCGYAGARVLECIRFSVSCDLCRAIGPAATTSDEAVEKWNQRSGCNTCEAYEMANAQLRDDLRKMDRRIKQLLKHRGHVAAEAVMDKMADEFSLPNASSVEGSADNATPQTEKGN